MGWHGGARLNGQHLQVSPLNLWLNWCKKLMRSSLHDDPR